MKDKESKYISLLAEERLENQKLKQQLEESKIKFPDDILTEFYVSIRLMKGEINLSKLFLFIIQKAKREKGITQKEIARELGLCQNTMSRMRKDTTMHSRTLQDVINYILSK